MDGHFKLLDHTADIGIEAEAGSLEELFRQAALGLLQVMDPQELPRSAQSKSVRLKGDEPAELLVAWLSEILYLLESSGLAPAEFEVNEVTERCFSGSVRGEHLDPDRHGFQREVKAVTWHQLTLFNANGRWHCRIFLDL